MNDIGLLFNHFITMYSDRMNVMKPNVDKSAIQELEKYRWMGNIRELRNVAERIIVLNGNQTIKGQTICDIDIPKSELLVQQAEGIEKADSKKYKGMKNTELYDLYLESNMSLSDFSTTVGISRTTLWRKFKEFES